MLQVRPGPSRVRVGDQLLLVGDKKRQEQTAILISHPIKCQNTTGKLTFTFWVYNGARLEVLMIEQRDDGKTLHILPEKPHIDCGTVHINTECTAIIPPIDHPYHIGLRAYDMRNTEGSFVLLDNLFYEAEFCRVSIDFGPDFHSERLISSSTKGEPVDKPSSLSCTEFDENCRWKNMGYGEHGMWRRAVGILPQTIIFNETGTDVQPNLPAAFLYIEEQTEINDATKAFRMLASDPIKCPGSTNIILQFRIWSTKGIQLNLCLFERHSMQQIEGKCQQVPIGTSPAIVQQQFQTPSETKEFMVEFYFNLKLELEFVFRVQNVNKDFDNFVLLDDIEMVTDQSSAYCGQLGADISANKGWLSDGGLFTAPMLNTLLNRPIHSARDLTCDFSKRALNCQWANLEKLIDGMTQWEIGILSGSKITKTSEDILIPVGDVALARLDSHNKSAVLLSERILCTLPSITNTNGNSGTLSFRTWGSGNGIKLGVCIIRADSLEVLDCQNVGGNDGDRKMTEEGDEGEVCPSLNNIAFGAKTIVRGGSGFTHKGERIVSNRQHEAFNGGEQKHDFHDIPDESEFIKLERAIPRHQSFHFFSDVCRLLRCDFERDGSMCLYTSTRVAASVSMFRSYNNSAFTVLFTRSKVAILESPIFHLNTPARLHFDYFVSKGPAKLHICQDSVMRDLSSCFIISAEGETLGWKHDFIEVLPTDRKLYLIARLEGKGRANVQIDNLELTDVMDHSIC
uniref:MAM domain-containing protein n=1 Tax=Meloidogyne hapla TaxID=6305 RepID=A0A1I8BMJ0_MELHA